MIWNCCSASSQACAKNSGAEVSGDGKRVRKGHCSLRGMRDVLWVGMASLELEGGGWRGGGITMWPDLLGIVWKLVWQRFGWGFLQCIHQKVVLLGQKPKDFIYLFTEEFWNTAVASTPAALQLPFLSSLLLVVVVYECCYRLSGQVNHAVSKFLLLYMFFPSWLEQCGDTEIVLADSLGRCL